MRIPDTISNAGQTAHHGQTITENPLQCVMLVLRGHQIELCSCKRPQLWEISVTLVRDLRVIEDVLTDGLKKGSGCGDGSLRI